MPLRDCFGVALSVCGLYGVDLQRAHEQHKYADGKWVYAEICGAFSAFTALLYFVPLLMGLPFMFVWDAILFVLWLGLFGLFGSMYIDENPEGDAGIQRMKNAVWVDLVNMLLWLFTTVAMAFYWSRHRGPRTRWTGRAKI